MTIYEIVILAIVLALDALIVSFSYGMVVNARKIQNALLLASSFGFFQFLMPLLGWNFTGFVYSHLEKYSKWIVFFVFLILGVKILKESFEKKDEHKICCIGLLCVLGLAVVTSIDAFGAGVSIRFLNSSIIFPALVIGFVTFFLSFIGFFVASIFCKLQFKYVEIIGSFLFFYLAVKSVM